MHPEYMQAFRNPLPNTRRIYAFRKLVVLTAPDEPAPLEALDEAADIAGVEIEVGDEIRGRRAVADGDLIDDTRFRQRERTAEQRLLKHAHPPSVETREPADAGNGLVETGGRHLSSWMNDDRQLPK